eukprot:1917202-Rhodomonas_salina.1
MNPRSRARLGVNKDCTSTHITHPAALGEGSAWSIGVVYCSMIKIPMQSQILSPPIVVEGLHVVAMQDGPTVLYEGGYREELTHRHATCPQLALPRQVLPVLCKHSIFILDAHPQPRHALVVQITLRRKLLRSLEHGVEVARGSEDGIAEQRIAPARALLVVSEILNKLL